MWYSSRATREIFLSVSKSMATRWTVPSGPTTPPCEEPVWIETLAIPSPPPSSFRYPSMYARSSSGVEFSLPTSPISPPTETGIGLGSRERMNFVNRAQSS